jgi:hypothetical protein
MGSLGSASIVATKIILKTYDFLVQEGCLLKTTLKMDWAQK